MLCEDDSLQNVTMQAETSLLLSPDDMKSFSPDGARSRGLQTPTDPNSTFMEAIATSANVDISNLADRSIGSGRTNNADASKPRLEDDTALQSDPGQYQDFHTIDWQRDLSRDRLRHMYISKRRMRSLMGAFHSLFDAGSGWICVLFVGIAAGSVAGVIDIGAKWMSDLKDGICIDQFWLDKEHCCWTDPDVSFKGADCKSWVAWPEVFYVFEATNKTLFVFLDLFFYVGLAVSMSGLCVMLVKVFAPYACGSGIPEIKCILSGFIIRGYLGKWTFIVKSVGLMLAASSGLSLGKEGPMVHLACCIGNIFSYIFPKYGKNEAKKREILSASAAAGVSVAFGAPIGGVMFSLEEASYYFPLKTLWRSFFCACIAGIILKMVNPFGSEQETLFQVDYKMRWGYAELILFSFLGVLGGVIGAAFIKANIRWCKFRSSSPRLGCHPIFEVLLVTFATALISYPNPYMRESMSALIKKLFDRCGPEDITGLCDYNRTFDSAKNDELEMANIGPGVTTAMWQMSIALVCRLVLTVFTFGIKVPAGLFVPSMAVGAIIGRIMGILVEQWAFSNGDSFFFTSNCGTGKQCITPGLYAMVGAAAVLGGVTRMTVSLVVIMFELTSSADFIVPTMAAVMFAKWVGDALGREGIYDAHIRLNGYPFLDNKEEYIVYTKASDVMAPRPGDPPLRTVTAASMTVGDLEQLLNETNYNGFPVVDSHNDPQYLIGFVVRRDLQMALKAARAQQEGIVTNSVVYFTEHKPNTPELVGQTPLALRGLMDQAPITIPSHTAMETVIEMFRKLGLRQTLVIENGCLLGIITKKDVLMHIHHIDDDV